MLVGQLRRVLATVPDDVEVVIEHVEVQERFDTVRAFVGNPPHMTPVVVIEAE